MPSYDCPTCGRRLSEPTLEQAPFRPFCCRRCKLIDLSKWFHEEYRIEAPLQIPSTGEKDAEKLP